LQKILIIGTRGFIGRYVFKEFNQNKKLSIFEGYKEKINLLDIQSFKNAFHKIKPDLIINLGAFSHLDKSSYQEVFEINSFALIKIFDFLIKENYDGKFINTSSALVYGSNTPNIVSEDLPFFPDHPYAVAKASIDSLINLIQHNLNVTTVRPFNCIGRGHRKDYVVPKIVEHFQSKKKSIKLGNCKSKRDFVDVRDVARMYWEISRADSNYNAFNLCSGHSVSIYEIVRLLEKISDHRIKIDTDKNLFRNIDNDNITGDNSRIKELGFEYKYSLENSLEWIFSESG
jgi:nucleoside-diphosphate-sugar epimerase